MNFLQLYYLASFVLFFAVFTSNLVTYDNIFDACDVVATDNFYSLIFYNFIIAASIFLTKCIVYYYTRNKKTKGAEEEFETLAADLYDTVLFSGIISSNIETSNVFLIGFIIFLYYVPSKLNDQVSYFYLSGVLPKISEHQRIISGQILFLFIDIFVVLKLFQKFLNSGQALDLSFAMKMYSYFSYSVEGLITHVIFLLDRNSFGNSLSSYKAKQNACVFNEIFQCLVSLGYTFYMVKHSGIPFYMIFILIQKVFVIKKQIMKIVELKMLSKMINEQLKQPTEEDLVNDPTCLVCRTAMESSSSKKLPCGHCFHTECLERWACQHMKCPYCGYDLNNILKVKKENTQNTLFEANNDIQNENNNPQNETNQQNLADLAHEEDHPNLETNQDSIQQAEEIVKKYMDHHFPHNNEDLSTFKEQKCQEIQQLLQQIQEIEEKIHKIKEEITEKQNVM